MELTQNIGHLELIINTNLDQKARDWPCRTTKEKILLCCTCGLLTPLHTVNTNMTASNANKISQETAASFSAHETNWTHDAGVATHGGLWNVTSIKFPQKEIVAITTYPCGLLMVPWQPWDRFTPESRPAAELEVAHWIKHRRRGQAWRYPSC